MVTLNKNKMKSKKNILPLLILMISLSFCCKQKKELFETKTSKNIYTGDSTLSNKNYFNTLVSLGDEKINLALQKQNEKYLKEYKKINPGELQSISKENYTTKLVNEAQHDKNNIKVNLYTIIGNKKIDSISFYRNISGNNFGKYICLSYFNPKMNKLWQIKYFPLNPIRGNSASMISYTVKSINETGIIKTDIIHFLDESLEVEMEKNELYY